MLINKRILAICCVMLIAIGGCSRQQSDWQKTREANTTDAYEQFLKKYPSGEFTAQAEARLKEMYEERDWQKARDADTPEAYQAFLKQYPEGKWTEEARIRVENFTLAQAPSGAGSPSGGSSSAPSAQAGPGTTNAAAQEAAPSGEQSGSETTAPPSNVPAKAPHRGAAGQPASQSHARLKGEPGKFAVQLGAFKSGRAAAHERWEHLEKQYPTLFSGVSSKVLAKKSGGATLYRLQAVGLSEPRARKICKVSRAKSQACVLVRPQHVT